MSILSTLRRAYRKNHGADHARPRRKSTKYTPNFEILETRIVPTQWSGDIYDGLGGRTGPLFTNDQVQEITGNVHVPAGKTLTIEAGTVVKFDNNTSLNVDGTLLAPGVTGQTIIITSINDNSPEGGSNTAANGNWGNITFSSDSTGNTLNDVNIAYGGGSEGSEIVDNASPLILTSSVVRNSSSTAVRIIQASPTLTADTFQNSSGSALSMDDASSPAISTPTIANNAINGLSVDAGTISTSMSWNNSGVVYYVSGGLTVASGATLTIDAGQIVKFDTGFSALIVNGTLAANGIASQSIVFTSIRDDSVGGDTNNDGTSTSSQPGDWQQVQLTSSSTNDVLTYVVVTYGGNDVSGELEADQNNTTISNCTFANSSDAGIRLIGSEAILAGDTFQNNQGAAVHMDVTSAPLITTPTISNNSVNGVLIDAGTITANTSWNSPNITYFVSGNVTVAIGATLSIGAGQIVKFEAGFSILIVNGTLTAGGTASQPVVFTSERDDSVGGDTNNDGSATKPQPGDWQQVQVTSSSTNDMLTYVVVAYGGNDVSGELEADGNSPSVSNSTFASSSDAGIRLVGSNAILTGDTFQNNQGAAVHMDVTSAPFITTPTVTNNSINGVLIDAGTMSANTSWNSPNITYVVSGNVTVAVGATLSIGAGQIVKFEVGFSILIVNGTLTASGTTALPVVFTSERDDSVGGDTNNDGTTTKPQPGDWQQVQLSSSSSNDVLTYVVVDYGGNDVSGELEADNSSPTISNSSLANSSDAGIRLVGSDAILSGDTFQNNQAAAVHMDATSAPVITTATVSNNSANGVLIDAGTISANTSWNSPDITYLVNGNVTVAVGATLSIGAGEIVKFEVGFSILIVNGTLAASGTAAQPVVFTSERDDSVGGDTNNDGSATLPKPGDWQQMQFTNSSTGDVLSHVVVAYGGNDVSGELEADGTSPSISNSAFENSSDAGIRLVGSNAILAGDIFQDNSVAAIRIDVASSPVITLPTLSNNGINGVLIDAGAIAAYASWNSPDVVYLVSGGITVSIGATLAIGAGQIVKFAEGFSSLDVNGTLTAIGTVTLPVVFTSQRDDSVGGDTNNDGSNTTPQPGDWQQVQFSSSSSGNVLTNVVVDFGGNDVSGELELDGAAATITGSTIENSSDDGLRLVGSAPTLTGDTFLNNAGPGISLDSASNPITSGLKASGNKINGFYVDGTTLSANTTWQAQGLPYLLNGNISIPQGITLTIAAGALVMGQDNISFLGAGAITNAGTLEMTSTDQGTMQVFPAFTNTGTVEVLSGTLSFEGALTNNGSGILAGNPGATLSFARNLSGNTTNAGEYSPSSVVVNGNDTASAPQTFEVMSQDLGDVAAGFDGNFAYYSLTLAPNAYLQLVDNAPNTGSTSPEALYVDNLTIPAGGTLDLNGLHAYAHIFQNNGTVLNGTVSILPSSGPIPENVTTTSTLAAGAIADWTFFGRAGHSSTIVVNTGSSGSIVPLPPSLGFSQVTLLDPNGNVVATASNTQSGVDVTLANVAFTVDGTYTVQIQAPAAQSNSAGDYDLTVWDATPQISSLNLNQTVSGTIDNPFRIDNWTFSATADQVVQFNLANVSTSALQFSLTGPNGYTAFSGATASSGNITLPSSGAYQLSVDTTGQTGSYAFQLDSTSVTDLLLGTPVTETIQGSGQSTYFVLNVTQPGQIVITLQDNTSTDENELYANFGSVPARNQFHPWFYTGASASKTLSIPTATPGNYYILVYNYEASSPGNQYTIEAQSAPFTLSTAKPNQINSADASTLLVSGIFPLAYQSSTAYQIQFVSAGGSVLPASPVYLATTGINQAPGAVSDGSITMSATLPANSLPAGAYSVRITDSLGNTKMIANALTVTAGGKGILKTNLIVPNPVGYHVPTTLYVQYSNVGTAPMPAPLLVLTAIQNGLAGAFLTLDRSLAGLGYVSDTTPAGFSQTVQFLASGAIPGILQPGESETVPVYDGGWLHTQWDFSRPPITFSLGELDTTNTQTIDWSSQEAGLRLGSISTAAWNAIAPIETANLGSTWGQYVQTLDNDAVYLASIGDPVDNVSQLLEFEAEKANAAFTTESLVSVTADDLPAPGMDLTFSQSFQASLAGRNTEGILGLGWTTNWDISATAMPNGDVAIQNDGTYSYFSLQPNGSFAPEAVDEGTTLTNSSGTYRLVGPDGSIVQFNANGTLNHVADTNGNTIAAGYNAQNQLISLTDSNGEFLNLSYNTQGFVSALTDSNGQTESYAYDGAGHLISYADLYGTTNYTYVTGQSAAQNNALAEVAYADNTHVFFGYDSQGRLIDQHRDGDQEDQTWNYLSPGGYVTSDANNNQTTVYFNLFGAAAETIDPLGNVTRYYYDSNQNLIKVIGPGGVTATGTYDTNGNLTSETDPLGQTTYFTYDANNNLTGYTDAKGNTTSYAYNSQNDLLSITYANGTTQQASYNPLGEATQFINANGQAIGSTYNADGLVATESFADRTSFAYTYDARGNLLTATDATGTTTFAYADAANPNFLTKVTYPDGTFLEFTYNAIGQRTQSVDQTGFTINYTYDALGRLFKLTDGNGNLIVQYTYDAAGNLVQKDNGNGTRTIYVFDVDSNLRSITNYVSAGGAVNSFDDYTNDGRGNVLTDTNQDGVWTYTYDADSQLTQAIFTPNNTDPDGLTAQNLQYVYDPAGNRISETVNGVTTTYVSNNVNEYTSTTTNGITTNNRYDNDGNLIDQTMSGSSTTYSYNELDQLTAVNRPGLSASYGYDEFGIRNSQTLNGVTTNFEIDPLGGNVIATFAAGGALTAHYTYGFGLVNQVSAAGVGAYYDFNNIGSTIGITGTNGSYLNQYSYLPFGQTTTLAASLANPFTYVGQFGVMNDGSGTFAMGFRQFDPSMGQFVSNDPLGLGGADTNIRRYVGNNPTNFIDPSGLEPKPLPWPLESIGQGLSYGAKKLSCGVMRVLTGVGRVIGKIDQWLGIENGGGLYRKWFPPKGPSQPSDPYGTPPGKVNPIQIYKPDLDDHGDDPTSACGAAAGGSGCPCQCPPVQDPDPTTGTTSTTTTVGVTSEDPNTIIGPGGFGTSHYVGAATLLPYEIEFQNSATATAPAQRVNIMDQLDPNLDWSTLQFTAAGFGSTYIGVPAGLQQFDTSVNVAENGQSFVVDIDLSFNQITGLLAASFHSIDPISQLPLASLLTGFLPPENGNGSGTGFVDFTIDPKSGLSSGTAIRNVAQISFDQGQIIATDQVDDDDPSKGTDPTKQALVTIDAGAPTSTVTALPAISGTSFTLNWSGQDDTGGSGIATYNIYENEDGGAFTLFETNTTSTSATFTGVSGHTYGFYSVATDNVGNVQPTSGVAQATTEVVDGGTLQFNSATYSANETDGTVTITVARTGTSSAAVSVNYATSDGTAVAGTGYTATSGTLNFAAGQSSATFTIPILDAGIAVGSQTVNLTLSSPTGGASLGSQATAVLTINDNDVVHNGQLQFSAATYSIAENAGSITITVNRTDGSAGVVTVHYATSDSTGQAGVNYQAASGTLTFQAGQTSQTFTVTALDDMVVDGDHTVNLTLSSPGGGASLGTQTTAVLTVTDADSGQSGVLALSTAATDVRETAGSITLTVNRTGGSIGSITVNYATSDGTAMAGTNYTATSGTLTFASGVTSQTIVIPILEDQAITPYLTFTVSLTAGSGALGTTTKTTVTIDNEDGTPNQRYIEAVYQALLLRPADGSGLSYWSGQLDSGVARSAVAAQLTHSAEYFQTNVIKPAYKEFLNRSADASGLSYWTQQLQGGETDEQMQAGFIASDEFFANSGGTNKDWIDALYQVLLGRQPDASGENYWVGVLQNGESRDEVANGFTGSQEGLGDRVLQTYERYLGRGASQSEIAFWVGQYGMGATNEVIVTSFIGSDEFFADSTK